ncbi:MAG TPA: PqqD family protein [Kofleriaceae bacterium]|nr:PqqD family protein [Kofleriaceae bacterium]
MTPLSSKRVYEVWTQVIQDEELYEAMLEGTHGRLEGRGLDAEAIAILDGFRAEPGTRWNIENLRFRSSLEVGDTIVSYMPRTLRLLTRGDADWRQDLCFEYLAHHRWRALGHMRLAECERFAAFVRSRVIKRRSPPPPHLEAVMAFELAVIGLLRATSRVAPDAWPVRREVTEAELPALRPRRSPVQTVLELDVDLRPWIESGDPSRGEVGPKPITLLIHMPSLDEPHRTKTISEGVRVVLESCGGDRTVEALAAELEDEYGLPAADVRRLVRTLLDERILCA